MRPVTPPRTANTRSRTGRRSDKEDEIESEDVYEKLRVLHDAVQVKSQHEDGAAREKSADKHPIEEEAKSHVSGKSKTTVYSTIEEEVEDLRGKLTRKKNQIEQEIINYLE